MKSAHKPSMDLSRIRYKVRKSRTVYSKGPITVIDCDVDMANGRKISRQVLEHPGSVVIIPETRQGKYLLIRQFRFAVKECIWEWPAGGIERGETFRQAAARELAEEVGLWPRRLKPLLTFYPTPGISGETMHLFLASGLVPRQAQQDPDEEIEYREFSTREIESMIRRGKIMDGKTIIGFAWMKYFKGRP
ncbi:MAG: NUDIX hydrolase [Candidatus Omnitrophota bacterium]